MLASSGELLELVHGLRRELLARGEFLPPTWTEEAATDLKTGALRGWVLPPDGPAGVAFFSPRPGRSYGHVHVAAGPGSLAGARALLAALRAGVAPTEVRLDVGLTGLAPSDEEALRAGADPARGDSVLFRYALERPVAPLPEAAWPDGWRAARVGDADLGELARLDWAAFQGTPDELLVAESPAEDRRVLEEILQGLLGRFLDEASTVLIAPDGAVGAFLLTAEQTPHRAVFLDLVVRPSARRQGLGGGLLRWGTRALAALGYDTVRLWVSETNAPARALYERLGFAPVGRAPIYRMRFAGPPGADGDAPQPQRAA